MKKILKIISFIILLINLIFIENVYAYTEELVVGNYCEPVLTCDGVDTNPTTVTIKDSTIATYDKTTNRIYGNKTGSTTITLSAGSGCGGTMTLVVSEPSSTNTWLKITPTSKEIYVGDSFGQFSFESNTNLQNSTITWESSNTSVATVSEKGLIKGVSSGTATITATLNKVAKASITITVKEPEITIGTYNKTMAPGDSQTISATVNPSDKKVSWSIDNDFIAYISNVTTNNVKLTAVSSGTVTLTASIGNTKKSITIDIKNGSSSEQSVSLNKSNESIFVGEITNVTATLGKNEGTVKWTSSDSSIAMVYEPDGGGNNYAEIQGLKEGTANITATIDGKSASMTVTVKKSGIVIKGNQTAKVSEKITLTASTSTNSNTDIEWTSSDSTIGKIIGSGNKIEVEGLKEGKITITAKAKIGSQTVSDSITLTFTNTDTPSTSGDLKLYPSSNKVKTGETVTITATSSTTISNLVWTIVNTDIFEIVSQENNTIVLKALKEGTSEIKAKLGDIEASCNIEVSDSTNTNNNQNNNTENPHTGLVTPIALLLVLSTILYLTRNKIKTTKKLFKI